MTTRFRGWTTACLASLLMGSAAAQDFKICPAANTRSGITVHQGADGFLFFQEDVATPLVSDPALKYLDLFSKSLRDRGSNLVIASLPSKGFLNYEKFDKNQSFFSKYDPIAAYNNYSKNIDSFNKLGIVSPDLTKLFSNQLDKEKYSFRRDSHWTPFGAKIIAGELARNIDISGMKKGINESIYRNVLTGKKTKIGDLIDAANNSCPGAAIPAEEEEIYNIIEDSSENSNSLLGDNKAEIVLWGTSFSAGNQSNFYNFLRESLKSDVVNAAVSAGGAWATVENYLINSKEELPKIFIWELPFRNGAGIGEINDINKFRQIIPMIHLYGKTKNPIVKNEIDLNLDKPNLLKSGTKFISSDWIQHRSSINFNKPSPDGKSEAIEINFNGDKDPWIETSVKFSEPIGGLSLSQSVWLWTDSKESTEAELFMYAMPGTKEVKSQKFILNNKPTQYFISNTFSNSLTESTIVFRVDGPTVPLETTKIYAWSPNLSRSNYTALAGLEKMKLTGDRYAINIRIDDLSVINFGLVLKYSDGKSEIVPVSRNQRVKNNGDFYMQLSNDFKSPLSSVEISLPYQPKGKINASIIKLK